MNKQRKDGIQQPTDWTRHIDRLPSEMYSITDIDFVVHQHKPCVRFMFVEQKTFDAEVGFAQHDTLSVVHQHLVPNKIMRVLTDRRIYANSEYMGTHLLQMSDATPQQSRLIRWNYIPISFETLIKIMRFDIDPRLFKGRKNNAS